MLDGVIELCVANGTFQAPGPDGIMTIEKCGPVDAVVDDGRLRGGGQWEEEEEEEEEREDGGGGGGRHANDVTPV